MRSFCRRLPEGELDIVGGRITKRRLRLLRPRASSASTKRVVCFDHACRLRSMRVYRYWRRSKCASKRAHREWRPTMYAGKKVIWICPQRNVISCSLRWLKDVLLNHDRIKRGTATSFVTTCFWRAKERWWISFIEPVLLCEGLPWNVPPLDKKLFWFKEEAALFLRAWVPDALQS